MCIMEMRVFSTFYCVRLFWGLEETQTFCRLLWPERWWCPGATGVLDLADAFQRMLSWKRCTQFHSRDAQKRPKQVALVSKYVIAQLSLCCCLWDQAQNTLFLKMLIQPFGAPVSGMVLYLTFRSVLLRTHVGSAASNRRWLRFTAQSWWSFRRADLFLSKRKNR